ncbi:MAG TPA: hypothetical protein VKV22_03945 [Rhodanobacteraceae bacterium]|nr:hypothetical protein [Rhodanobacteraceae bacterium]
MKYYVPHSPEWFTALEFINPAQAAGTRKILELAGDPGVCSVCGDSPAKDYEVVGVSFGAGVSATIRLCGDCKGIRETMHGESFRELSA